MFSTDHHSLFMACEEFRNPGMCFGVDFLICLGAGYEGQYGMLLRNPL